MSLWRAVTAGFASVSFMIPDKYGKTCNAAMIRKHGSVPLPNWKGLCYWNDKNICDIFFREHVPINMSTGDHTVRIGYWQLIFYLSDCRASLIRGAAFFLYLVSYVDARLFRNHWIFCKMFARIVSIHARLLTYIITCQARTLLCICSNQLRRECEVEVMSHAIENTRKGKLNIRSQAKCGVSCHVKLVLLWTSILSIGSFRRWIRLQRIRIYSLRYV